MKLSAIRHVRGLLGGLVLVALLLVAPAEAGAASSIEGVWSFNGGKVAVEAQPGGTYIGTVVEPTKFSTCFHRTGERMWTDIHQEPDGSYWGLHQWLYNDPECTPNPTLGKTAWRVIEEGTSRFLRVCFSEPGSESQPTIAPDGTTAGDTFGCSDSALVSELPVVEQATAGRYIPLPANGVCLARPKLLLRLVEPSGDPFAKIAIALRSGGVKRRPKLIRKNGTVHATFNLLGLTSPWLKVTVTATTVLGHTITAKRSYKRCEAAVKHHLRTYG
jgi:hypothetical protein